VTTVRTRDGRELFLTKRPGPSGNTAPTVVFEGGLAASRSYWALVQPEVAKSADAVAYDRSGLGRSAPDPAPRNLQRLADDLNELLDGLGAGPFVLVGHSWGGLIVRVAAAAKPDRIAGLVLVDATDEACDLLFHPSVRRAEKIGQRGSMVLARLGLLGVAFRKLTAALPPAEAADMRKEGYTVAAMRTRRAELGSVFADLTELLDHPLDLAAIPTTVISAGQPSMGINAQALEAIKASHKHRAAESTQGRHVLADHAGHMVPIDAPAIIVAEIERLIRELPDR
jgi:pimeloyl-ACP methyl ester carboxylesterase